MRETKMDDKVTVKEVADNLENIYLRTISSDNDTDQVSSEDCLVAALFRISKSLDTISGRLCSLVGRLCSLEQTVCRVLDRQEGFTTVTTAVRSSCLSVKDEDSDGQK